MLPEIARQIKKLQYEVERLKTFDVPRDSFGWINPFETWVYSAATTIAISGDKTSKYTVGDKIRLVDGGSPEYFYIVSLSYSAPNTYINLSPNSDYSLSGGAITANYYSKEATPAGFPHWLNYAPTLDGFSANPTNTVYRFMLVGRKVTVCVRQLTAGTSDATDFTITAPMTAATIANMVWGAATWSHDDNGAALTTPGRAFITSGSGTITIGKDSASSTTWTNANGKRTNFTLEYEI